MGPPIVIAGTGLGAGVSIATVRGVQEASTGASHSDVEELNSIIEEYNQLLKEKLGL